MRTTRRFCWLTWNSLYLPSIHAPHPPLKSPNKKVLMRKVCKLLFLDYKKRTFSLMNLSLSEMAKESDNSPDSSGYLYEAIDYIKTLLTEINDSVHYARR
eukprot:TRINITY_DN3643_c0_g1_i13.p1 TRINITY_DN3643_c0_g1~~TRINITY_DN3643_c0_g1_i13.p1  ORF type:complete len:100 (+),score=1.29 TRINITY_DN3643_c0_g1_i13:192-491(+)